MRTTVTFFPCVMVLSLTAPSLVSAQGPQPIPVSEGVYRLPFADGTSVTFSNDHTNHPASLNRIDMTGAGAPTVVVSAAAGWVRIIVENNDTFCPNACGPNNDCDGDGITTAMENQQAQNAACGSYGGPSQFCCERDFESNGGTCPGSGTCGGGPNNFVWMEHPNGEWTKYTHLLFNTVGNGVDNNGNNGAGRVLDEFIAAGTPLGIEGDVGFASGPHVHFEVAVPYYVALTDDLDTLNMTEADPELPDATEADWFNNGFLNGDGIQDDVVFEDTDGDGVNDPDDDVNRQNRIPVFCQVDFPPGQGDTNTAGPCNDLCDAPVTDLSGVTVSNGTPYYVQVANTTGNPNGDFVVEAYGGASIRAGSRITLSPGFHAELNANFTAAIGNCDTPGGTGE